MKKTISVLAVCIAATASAQSGFNAVNAEKALFAPARCYAYSTEPDRSFQKNVNVISFGGDLGVYQYTSRIKSTSETKTDGAANKALTLQYERGVLNWLGIGAKFQYSSYFTSTDSVTHTKPSVNGFDAMVLANAHFVRTRHIDLLAGFTAGYSHLNYTVHDSYASQAVGGGSVFDIHLQPRFYFGNHIGMFINLAYVHYGYGSLDFQNTATKLDDAMSLKGGGINFGIGIQAKF